MAAILGCSGQNTLGEIKITETAGLDRPLEYVKVRLVGGDTELPDNLMLKNPKTGESIFVQVMKASSDKDSITIMFPVEIRANQSKSYEIHPFESGSDSLSSSLVILDENPSIENKIFKATFSTEKDARGGQVDGILLKNSGNQLLERGHISMHWAPNFSKSDSENYFNFEHLPGDAENSTKRFRYHIEKYRSGKTDSVPEIHLKGKYTFMEGLPYFLFESTMTVHQEVELDLLRNDEMTMDSLFTHVVYQNKNGRPQHLALYGGEIDSLEENPIPDDADFVAFYHREKGYGLGSIRLEYDNLNLEGSPSPVTGPYTKISKSRGNGRYWNRVLTDTVQRFSKGSRYHEKNAYLVFDAGADPPEAELLRYHKQLVNPLEVVVSGPITAE